VRKLEFDRTDAKADLNYAPCKGQIVLVVRGENGISLVKRGEGHGWSLPSDRIGPAEDVWKSAKRVAKDQCGVMIRSAELAGIYDVVWHYRDVSIKRLHFVYAAMTDDLKCAPSKDKGVSEAKFFKEIPHGVQDDEIQRLALADSSTK
jgi:ADP-ribose pyrophosphatase YjhB (NUDIX family)